jgi:general secretion pathway protein I
MSARTSHRGFTLLEVVIALAILAMGLMAVSDVVGGALRNHVRAHQLEVATLLARGKLAEVEDRYEEEGFKITDESDEGSFEDQGHPEVKWRLDVTTPTIEAGGDSLCSKLLGDGGVAALLPKDKLPASSGGGPTTVNPVQGMIESLVKEQCATFTATVKQAMREVRLAVSWPDGPRTEAFTVRTHLVVLQPRKGQP